MKPKVLQVDCVSASLTCLLLSHIFRLACILRLYIVAITKSENRLHTYTLRKAEHFQQGIIPEKALSVHSRLLSSIELLLSSTEKLNASVVGQKENAFK